MSQAEILTSTIRTGKFSLDEAGRSRGLAHRSSSTQAGEVVVGVGHSESGRLLAPLSPQAAAVLPVMLALARLQARRALTEQAQ